MNASIATVAESDASAQSYAAATPPGSARPTVSVIVPLYNVAPYLEKCLSSIATQTESRIEVLLIDDGSTDASRSICDAISAADPRFRVFSKPNEGQALARNFGLTKAHGKYIAFVDGDDWIDPHTYGDCVALLESSGADFVNFGLDFVRPDGRVKARFGSFRQESLTGDRMVELALLDEEIYSSPCNKLYRRETLERGQLKFPPVRGCEDVFFSRGLALVSQRAVFTERTYYHALVREGSTTRNLTAAYFVESGKVVAAEREFFEKRNRMEAFEGHFQAHVVKLFSYLMIQAAFRIPDAVEFAQCMKLADQSGFSQYLKDDSVVARLARRNRIMARACRHPRLLRAAARIAQAFRWHPY